MVLTWYYKLTWLVLQTYTDGNVMSLSDAVVVAIVVTVVAL